MGSDTKAVHQTTMRWTDEDLEAIERVQKITGILSRSEALRFVLRDYLQRAAAPAKVRKVQRAKTA